MFGGIINKLVSTAFNTLFFNKTAPVFEGEIKLKTEDFKKIGLSGKEGVPHIYAETKQDALFGMGFAHAQDRLFQIEGLKRLSSGRLSELQDNKTFLMIDRFSRKFGFRKIAEEHDLPQLKGTKEEKDTICYVNGVNAFIKSSYYRKPSNYVLLGLGDVEEYTVLDFLAIIRSFAWQFNLYGWLVKIVNESLEKCLSKEDFQAIFSSLNFDNDVPIARTKKGLDINEVDWEKVYDTYVEKSPEGSQAFVISGKYTESGGPILSNDTHLENANPSAFYRLAIHLADGFNVSGFSIAGTYCMAVGVNNYLSWGATLSCHDVYEIYKEEVRGNKYKVSENEWKEFETRKEIIKIGKKKEYIENVRVSRHGPVLSDLWAFDNLKSDVKIEENEVKDEEKEIEKEYVYTIRTIGTEKFDTINSSICDIGWSKTYQEFRDIGYNCKTISLSYAFSDKLGNIGYTSTGTFPIRSEKNIKNCTKVQPGWEGNDYEWIGFIPKEKMPICLNPERGYIVCANHRVAPDDYEYFIGKLSIPATRADKIEELILKKINEKKKITMDDALEIQLNDELPKKYVDFFHGLMEEISAEGVLEKLYNEYQKENPKKMKYIKLELVKGIIEQIRKFNGRMSVDSCGATCYFVFKHMLLTALLKQNEYLKNDKYLLYCTLGGGLNRYFYCLNELNCRYRTIFENLFENEKIEGSLVNKIGGKLKSIFIGIVDTVVRMRKIKPKVYNKNADVEIQNYKWGDFHTISFNHGLGDIVKNYNVGPKPMGGSELCVLCTFSDKNLDDLTICDAPVMRFIIDFGKKGEKLKSKSILPPGNSENPCSKYYKHNFEKFCEGKTNDLLFYPEDVKQKEDFLIKFE